MIKTYHTPQAMKKYNLTLLIHIVLSVLLFCTESMYTLHFLLGVKFVVCEIVAFAKSILHC